MFSQRNIRNTSTNNRKRRLLPWQREVPWFKRGSSANSAPARFACSCPPRKLINTGSLFHCQPASCNTASAVASFLDHLTGGSRPFSRTVPYVVAVADSQWRGREDPIPHPRPSPTWSTLVNLLMWPWWDFLSYLFFCDVACRKCMLQAKERGRSAAESGMECRRTLLVCSDVPLWARGSSFSTLAKVSVHRSVSCFAWPVSAGLLP